MLKLAKKRNNVSEESIQILIMDWAKLNPILKVYLIHIPNGGYNLSLPMAAKFKRLGRKAGVPDLFLAYPNGSYAGLWIELKSKSGKLSYEQKLYLNHFSNVGFFCAVCYSFDEAKEVITQYLNMEQNGYGKTRKQRRLFEM